MILYKIKYAILLTLFMVGFLITFTSMLEAYTSYRCGIPRSVMYSFFFILGMIYLFCYFLSMEYDKDIKVSEKQSVNILTEYPQYIDFIKEEYCNAKGKKVAMLYLALVHIGALSTSNRTDFYKFFLSELNRQDTIRAFRKGVDKYLNVQGKSNSPEWLTATITQSDIAPIIEKLSSLSSKK